MLLVFQWHDVTCKNRTATGMKHCHHVDGSKNAKSKLLRTGTYEVAEIVPSRFSCFYLIPRAIWMR